MSRTMHVYAMWEAERRGDTRSAHVIRERLKVWPLEPASERRAPYRPEFVETVAGQIIDAAKNGGKKG